jgi:hypothetical protein
MTKLPRRAKVLSLLWKITDTTEKRFSASIRYLDVELKESEEYFGQEETT